MDKVTLKHGRGYMSLEKSDDLIAIRPSSQSSLGTAIAQASGGNTSVVGTKLDEFELVRVDRTPSLMGRTASDVRRDNTEDTLDNLRKHHLVDAGSHVYHTPNSTAPIVPTGKITLRFTPSSTEEQRQRVLSDNHLEIVDASVDTTNGTEVTTYRVRITPDSVNPLKVVERLQQAGDVVSLAEADLATPGSLLAFALPSDTLVKEQWHLRNTGTQFGTTLGLKKGADARVIAAWQRAQSLGSPACVVGVIDDGFDLTHPDLSGNTKVVAPWDFTTNTNDPSPRNFDPDPRRSDYHGTACAGVAVGNANGVGITGAAPNCRFMPIRWTGTISDDTITQQFAYVAAQGAWVVSCSWGVAADFFQLSTTMNEAIARCARQGRDGLGCVIVFAAGNSNHNINDPNGRTLDGFAVHPDVIAVAACNSLDQKSNYSNFGEEISVCAPSNGTGGRGIITSDVRGTFQSNGNTFPAGYDAGDYTRTFGGTSSATPLVAGICALILSVNPGLTARQVKEILESTARRIGPRELYDNRGHSSLFGFGCVNADEAVKKAMALAPAPRSISPISPVSPARSNGDGETTVAVETLYGSEFWGISRHELIAGVAVNFLNTRAKSEVARLLAPIGQTLREVAGWADQIKGKKPSANMDDDTRKFLQQFPNDRSRSWHYVNIPVEIESYAAAQKRGFTGNDDDLDVVQVIRRCVQVLQRRDSFISPLNALRWLVHLAGDVHQPLHVGCGFIDDSTAGPRLETRADVIKAKGLRSDKGGNALVLPIGGSITLHSYWDTYLSSDLESSTHSDLELTANASRSQITAEVAISKVWGRLKRARVVGSGQPTVAVLDTPGDPADWVINWANNSLAEARKAYRFLQIKKALSNGKYEVSWPGKIAYDAECRPIVSQQLATAANNLAVLLNAVFAS